LPKTDHFFLRGFDLRPSLLDQLLKEHREVEDLNKDFQAPVSQQQEQIEALIVGPGKASARVEASKFATGRIRGGGPPPKVVNNP